ncbi:MAG: transcriptional regulator [Elusimicrobia bacterium CG_4_10_14_0_2_um_filter_56_8]|nr:MAG: transcriptional regulator [Elusimicrobia bacterium CG_4_10_14_0_2_um_filter_56_8]
MKNKASANAEKLAKTLRHIAHPLRLLIICLLARQEMLAGELTAQLGTTKGNISQHLRILADNGLVASRRDGNKIIYRIKDGKLVKLLDTMKKLYCPNFNV